MSSANQTDLTVVGDSTLITVKTGEATSAADLIVLLSLAGAGFML